MKPVKLNQDQVVECIVQWTGLKHGIPPNTKLVIKLMLVDGKILCGGEQWN